MPSRKSQVSPSEFSLGLFLGAIIITSIWVLWTSDFMGGRTDWQYHQSGYEKYIQTNEINVIVHYNFLDTITTDTIAYFCSAKGYYAGYLDRGYGGDKNIYVNCYTRTGENTQQRQFKFSEMVIWALSRVS